MNIIVPLSSAPEKEYSLFSPTFPAFGLLYDGFGPVSPLFSIFPAKSFNTCFPLFSEESMSPDTPPCTRDEMAQLSSPGSLSLFVFDSLSSLSLPITSAAIVSSIRNSFVFPPKTGLATPPTVAVCSASHRR